MVHNDCFNLDTDKILSIAKLQIIFLKKMIVMWKSALLELFNIYSRLITRCVHYIIKTVH